MIDGEKYDHQAYIYGYKVSTCQAWQHGKCSKEDSECFDSHCNPPLRRKPHLQHGRFNYIPTRCRYLSEKEECPQTIHCRFAHCTEEVIYHPSKFRTQLCQNGLDPRGICEGYGYHCAKAHSEADLRPAVFETMDNPACLYMTLDELSDFVCAPKDRKEERQFYMYVYKTRRCDGYPYNCGCDGLDYHRGHERRRSGVIKYLPMACPNIKPFPKSEWGDPYDDTKCVPVSKPKKERNKREATEENSNEEIWDCQYAHTLMEVMYHPQVYKTDLCQHFDENDPANWRCVWKKRCAHSHGKADLRTKDEAVQEWKAHMGESMKGRKLPSLVEQIIAAPNLLDKDPASLMRASELAKAFAEEFNLRGLEDRKNLQVTPPTQGHTQQSKSDFTNPSSNNPPLHNLHVRQSAQRSNQPRRASLPLLSAARTPSQQPPPPPQLSQHGQLFQQMMQNKKDNLKSRSGVVPPPPPPKQQLPSPGTQPGNEISKENLNAQKPTDTIFQKLPTSGFEKYASSKPPPPPPTSTRSSPQLPPEMLPPPPPHHVGREAFSEHTLKNFQSQMAPSEVLFPHRRAESLEEAQPNKALWQTPKPIEPQRQASPKQKWMPLFDLGASTWASSPGSSPEVSSSFRSLGDHGDLLASLRPDTAAGVREASSKASTSKDSKMKNLVEELERVLECPFEENLSSHQIVEPITTPCCGLSFCRNCTEMYLAAVDGAIGWPLRCVELKDKYPSEASATYIERESGRCICGHWIVSEEVDIMIVAGRRNFTVDSFLEVTRRYAQ